MFPKCSEFRLRNVSHIKVSLSRCLSVLWSGIVNPCNFLLIGNGRAWHPISSIPLCLAQDKLILIINHHQKEDISWIFLPLKKKIFFPTTNRSGMGPTLSVSLCLSLNDLRCIIYAWATSQYMPIVGLHVLGSVLHANPTRCTRSWSVEREHKHSWMLVCRRYCLSALSAKQKIPPLHNFMRVGRLNYSLLSSVTWHLLMFSKTLIDSSALVFGKIVVGRILTNLCIQWNVYWKQSILTRLLTFCAFWPPRAHAYRPIHRKKASTFRS